MVIMTTTMSMENALPNVFAHVTRDALETIQSFVVEIGHSLCLNLVSKATEMNQCQIFIFLTNTNTGFQYHPLPSPNIIPPLYHVGGQVRLDNSSIFSFITKNVCVIEVEKIYVF